MTRQHRLAKSKDSFLHLLEEGSLDQMRANKQLMLKRLKYEWMLYTELARQRNEIQDEIKSALLQSCQSDYQFKKWQRAVKYKYGLHPLSTKGALSFIGGRFNTGRDVNSEVPNFPALYLAKNKDTALQEHLAQIKPRGQSKLTARETALTNPNSEVIVSVSGQVSKVFDLTTHRSLTAFVKLIKEFTLSKELIKLSKQLKLPEPEIVKTPELLLDTLLNPDWRFNPIHYDVPANSQILGHLVYTAGIEGILYPSKFTDQPCLAIFPNNFCTTNSFVQIDDEAPVDDVPKRIDASNWRICDLEYREISIVRNHRPL